MSTTTITDETATIELRAGATLSVCAISDGTADVTFTEPGWVEQTVTVEGTPSFSWGPYPVPVSFSIDVTGSVEAVTTFNTRVLQAILMLVDALPTVGAPGILYQTEGALYWWDGDAFVPAGNGAAGSFTSLTASGLLRLTGTEDGLTAHAGGGKASALALSAAANMHRISTCATAADSVLMPAATAGQVHFIRNDGAEAMQIFGAGTDTINGVATGTGISLAAGAGITLVCMTAGKWVAC